MSDFLASPSTKVSGGVLINFLCCRGEELGLHTPLQSPNAASRTGNPPDKREANFSGTPFDSLCSGGWDMEGNSGKLSGHTSKARTAVWCGSTGWKNVFKYSCSLTGKNKSFGGAGGTLEAADSIFREESPQTLEFEEAEAVGSPGSQLHRVGWCRLCGCCGEDNKSF